VPVDGSRDFAVPLDWVKETLRTSQASSSVLILDACHAGAAAKGVSGIAPSLAAGASGMSMLLSCGVDEVSYEDSDAGRSVFSLRLVDGLSGGADADSDRNITLSELYEYTRARMKDWAVETGKTQLPELIGAPPAGLVIARIPDVPTLSVTALDAATGAAVAADVYLDGAKIGAAPISGRHLEKGRRYRLEVKGDMREPYAETLVVSRGGVHAVKARLAKMTMRVPSGFRAAPGTEPEPYTNTGWAKEVIHEKTGIEMVFIPAGEFMMGSPSGESGRYDDEGPRHWVRITRPFYLGKYEVTVGQWKKFSEATGYRTEAETGGGAYVWTGKEWGRRAGSGWRTPGFAQTDDHPVTCISWNDSLRFCRWGGLEVPTEAQWEYACRAGTTTAYHWGESADAGAGWCNGADETSRKKFNWGPTFSWSDGYVYTAPVGSFRTNAWGLYDMHGNVWEWCADWYDSGYYARSPGSDPQGPSSGKYRVLRGGSWSGAPRDSRSPNRANVTPDYADTGVGLRVAAGLD